MALVNEGQLLIPFISIIIQLMFENKICGDGYQFFFFANKMSNSTKNFLFLLLSIKLIYLNKEKKKFYNKTS